MTKAEFKALQRGSYPFEINKVKGELRVANVFFNNQSLSYIFHDENTYSMTIIEVDKIREDDKEVAVFTIQQGIRMNGFEFLNNFNLINQDNDKETT